MLYLVCGKIASGKSTLAARLAEQHDAITIAEDAWLGALFSDQMKSGADYVRCSEKLRAILGPHLVALLKAGLTVVLDFPANTVETRRWMREILDASGSAHELHLLDLPDALCLERLRQRNAEAEHPFAVTEAQFERFSRHFVAPGPDEGFVIVRHEAP